MASSDQAQEKNQWWGASANFGEAQLKKQPNARQKLPKSEQNMPNSYCFGGATVQMWGDLSTHGSSLTPALGQLYIVGEKGSEDGFQIQIKS